MVFEDSHSTPEIGICVSGAIIPLKRDEFSPLLFVVHDWLKPRTAPGKSGGPTLHQGVGTKARPQGVVLENGVPVSPMAAHFSKPLGVDHASIGVPPTGALYDRPTSIESQYK